MDKNSRAGTSVSCLLAMKAAAKRKGRRRRRRLQEISSGRKIADFTFRDITTDLTSAPLERSSCLSLPRRVEFSSIGH